MNEFKPCQSLLAADIGSTLTHLSLIDQVEGGYRFVAQAEAPTTLDGPENDLTTGLRRAIRRLEQVTQRTLLDAEGELITPETLSGTGVDVFVATANAAPPLRCAIVGLTNDLSIESAQRACAAANVEVTLTVSLGTRMRRWDDKALTTLYQTPPDVLLMVGGIDSGPVAPLESAARVLVTVYEQVERERRPLILFAGNQEARRPLAAILATLFDYRVVDNVRPSLHTESLGEAQRELAEVYERVKLTTLPGYRRLRLWCTDQGPSSRAAPILSTAEAFGNTLRFIARRNDLPQGVLGVDVGGATVAVGAARGEIYQWSIGAGLGTSYGAQRVLDLTGAEDVRRWVPLALSADDTRTWIANTHLRPHSVPQTMEDLLLTHAIVRQAILLTLRTLRQQYWARPTQPAESALTPTFDLIALRGGAFAHTPQDGVIALTLLDAVQPVGLTRLVLDWASLWPQLGALAAVAPLAAAQVLERDGFRDLGTLIAPIGELREGEHALSLRIVRDDGQAVVADVPAGTIQRFPLGAHEFATVEVRPHRSLDIGLGRKGFAGKTRVRGGSLGLVVDTRGRPLGLPQDAQHRQAKLQEWLGNLLHDDNATPPDASATGPSA